MPIELDVNQNTEDFDASLQNIVIQGNIRNMGMFSKHLTGNALTKAGLFRKDESTPIFVVEEITNLIGKMNNHVKEHYHLVDAQILGNRLNRFHYQENYDRTNPTFQYAETKWLHPLPPSMLYNSLRVSPYVQKINTKQKQNARGYTFPVSSLYDMDAIDNWTKIGTAKLGQKDVTIRMKVMVDHAFIYKRKADGRDKTEQGRGTAVLFGYYPIVAVTVDGEETKTVRFQHVDGAIGANRTNQFGELQMAVEKGYTPNQAYANIFTLDTHKNRPTLTFNFGKMEDDMLNFVVSIGATNVHITHKDVYYPFNSVTVNALLDEQAKTMEHTNEYIESFFEYVVKPLAAFETDALRHKNDPSSTPSRHVQAMLTASGQLMDMANRIENDTCETKDYANRFLQIRNHITQQQMETVISHSLRLQLSERLHTLNTIKQVGGLHSFKANDPVVKQRVEKATMYSPAQKKIILSEEPLVIAQAGAGSGKSHTLVGRINYLEAQKENLETVMVLSFTNVAAKNIKQRFNGVRSETLARMFKEIYELNHPTHQLTHPSTLLNTIEALNKKSAYFRQRGLKDENVTRAASILMSALTDIAPKTFTSSDTQAGINKIKDAMSTYYNEMIAILDATEQTTLEIQPIVLHHMIRHMHAQLQLPHVYQNLNYIITDESQDISTFEYIMLLELTIHYQSQLWIIGDGSQTLYEFRNSDPRYMNALESSGVFKTFKLETNYRSNQAILNVANQFLQVIDANKNAKIQLSSSNLQPTTVNDIKERVKIHDIIAGKKDKQDELILSIEHILPEFKEWLLEKLDNNEQVAVMAWARRDAIAMEQLIENIISKTKHSKIQIHNITKERKRPTDTFSLFANRKQKDLFDLKAYDGSYEQDVHEMIAEFIESYYHRGSDKMRAFLTNRLQNFLTHVFANMEYKVLKKEAGKKKTDTSSKAVSAFIIREFVREETRINTMDQLLNQDKEEIDTTKMQILVSTIHGTKGLEFDNTVVLFDETKRNATSQEALRMFFVALSRAKHSEMILNFRYQSDTRVVGSNESDMFKTPMHTAILRAVRDVSPSIMKPATP